MPSQYTDAFLHHLHTTGPDIKFDKQNYSTLKLSEGMGGQTQASEYLDSLGIKGVKYLDGSSRNAGEGAHNYVTFSPETQSVITHENGQRIPGAVEDAYSRLRDPESRSILEQMYPELKGFLAY